MEVRCSSETPLNLPPPTLRNIKTNGFFVSLLHKTLAATFRTRSTASAYSCHAPLSMCTCIAACCSSCSRYCCCSLCCCLAWLLLNLSTRRSLATVSVSQHSRLIAPHSRIGTPKLPCFPFKVRNVRGTKQQQEQQYQQQQQQQQEQQQQQRKKKQNFLCTHLACTLLLLLLLWLH